jgi:hypothetical protein
MKAFAAAAAVLLVFCAGAASASVQRHASLRALNLAPPIFRGSGFGSRERVTVSLRGLHVRPVQVRADDKGRFRVRLASLPSCKAWTVRALGNNGGTAVYRHARCASLNADVEGVVRRGPTKNICGVGESCSVPDSGVTVEAFQAAKLVAKTTTDGHGRFSFSLADGPYTVRAVGRGTEPKTVDVKTSSVAHLAFMVDTGIR